MTASFYDRVMRLSRAVSTSKSRAPVFGAAVEIGADFDREIDARNQPAKSTRERASQKRRSGVPSGGAKPGPRFLLRRQKRPITIVA